MRTSLVALACVLFAAQSSFGAFVTFSRSERAPTAAEIAGEPTLAGRVVREFFVTTSGDILSVNNVTITINGSTNGSQLYRHPLGSDSEAPHPAFVAVIPALGASSWIDTPGGTSPVGGGFAISEGTWFDTEDNGPQTNYQFARLTMPGTANWQVKFTVSIPSDNGQSVENFSYIYPIPEPASLVLTGIGFIGLLATRRHGRI